MMIIRVLLLSILAPLSACVAASLVLYGIVDRGSFAPLLFTFLGALLLLAPGYGTMKERGIALTSRYLLLLLLGGMAGALMLAFISVGNADGPLIGGFYGVMTSICWIVLHFVSGKIFARKG